MDNKKFNAFALIMIVVMAVFSIYTALGKSDSKDGRDGMSAYERALELGEFSGSEYEYLKSLHGKNGSNVTLEDVYEAYIEEKNFSKSDFTFSDFILTFYPDEMLDARGMWTDKTAYDEAANKLAQMFSDNFKEKYPNMPSEIIAAGPSPKNYSVK